MRTCKPSPLISAKAGDCISDCREDCAFRERPSIELYGFPKLVRPMEEGKSVSEHLKLIFDLCDADKDGVIAAKDFRVIGQEHFGKTQLIDQLVQEMDPDSSGHITFSKFCQGVETFLSDARNQSHRSRQCSLSSNNSTEELSSLDSAFSGDVYPLTHHHHHLSCITNGYDTIDDSCRHSTVEMVADGGEEEEEGHQRRPLLQSTPSAPDNIRVTPVKDSSSMIARHLLHRNGQLTLPESPSRLSHGSTPAEIADEEVSKLSDQLQDLTSRLEDLQEDQRDIHDSRTRLKRENTGLKMRLEEYEEELRETEESSQQMLNESQEQFKTTVAKVRRESAVQLDDLKSQLHNSSERLNKLQDTEMTLRNQLSMVQEECEQQTSQLGEVESRMREVDEELRKTKEQLRAERWKWEEEREGFKQELQDKDHQLEVLRAECQEVHAERKRNSITASDMGGEVERLKKEVERLKKENSNFQAQFLQQGKELLTKNSQSLAAEMEHASKEEVVKTLKDTEEHNARLHQYIEGLLVTIIDKHPDLLEKP